MGEVADEILEGERCEECARPIPEGQSPGYPRKCSNCKPWRPREKKGKSHDRPYSGDQ